MKTKGIKYRTESKSKTIITISVDGVLMIRLAQKDIAHETEITKYATTIQRRLGNSGTPIKIKVNFIEGEVFRYKYNGVKYNGSAVRYVTEFK